MSYLTASLRAQSPRGILPGELTTYGAESLSVREFNDNQRQLSGFGEGSLLRLQSLLAFQKTVGLRHTDINIAGED